MIKNIKAFLQNFIEKDTTDMPAWKRIGLRTLQTLYATQRDLTDGQLSLQAMSLVYTTLITLVPLLAISFSVLKGFGVHNQIEPFLYNLLEGLGPEKSTEVVEKIIGFVDNIKVGVLGAVGFGLLIYSVVALMQKIENAFNYIWRVGKDRTLSQRFSNYLSVLLVGPLLIFISAGITTTIRHSAVFKQIEQVSVFGPLYEVASVFVPWLVLALGFSFIYLYMPNTKVKISAAFMGALVAAMLWKAIGFLFASFIAGSANYVAIYAAFATLIVLMIWLYASWLIILIGANISFYVQYPRYLRVRRAPLLLSPRLRIILGLGALEAITIAHYKGKTPWSVDSLSKHLNVPILAMQKVLDSLEEEGILTTSQAMPAQYFPAKPFDQTPLEEAIAAIENHGRAPWLKTDKMHNVGKATKLFETMKQAREKSVSSKTISKVFLDN